MTNFTITEGSTSSFQYSFRGFQPEVEVRFVEGTASSEDGFGGTLIGTSQVNINGYVTATYTYSFGAKKDTIDESDEQFSLNIYFNGVLDETVTVTILDDLANHGTEASDTWAGDSSDDIYFSYSGADTIEGRTGNDAIYGGQGYDRLIGGSGDDSLYGQSGNDTLNGGTGADILAGGGGDDVITGGKDNDTQTGGAGHDQLNGGGGNDSLSGSKGDDFLSGGSGHDHLLGGNGADLLKGGNGHDTLAGGKGNDTLFGGAASDTFVFSRKSGHDTIADFNAAGREKIDISEAVSMSGFKYFRKNFAQDTSEGTLIELNEKSSILLEGVSLSELSGNDFIF